MALRTRAPASGCGVKAIGSLSLRSPTDRTSDWRAPGVTRLANPLAPRPLLDRLQQLGPGIDVQQPGRQRFQPLQVRDRFQRLELLPARRLVELVPALAQDRRPQSFGPALRQG